MFRMFENNKVLSDTFSGLIHASLSLINPLMAKGVDATLNRFFSNFSQKWEELLLQTKFLPVGSSLGHLPMKKFFRSDLPSWLES